MVRTTTSRAIRGADAKGASMTANETRKHRLASLTRQARALRDEAARGFTDNGYNGRLIATAKEIKDCTWRLICDCETQAEKLREKIR